MEGLSEREALDLALEYELWANARWYPALAGFKDRERAERVLWHVIDCYRGWYEGITGVELSKSDSMADDCAVAVQAWRDLINDRDPDEVIRFERGPVVRSFTIGQVARHVCNHGTYHRGHLRGLADAEGLEAFEDTDYTLWLRLEGIQPQPE